MKVLEPAQTERAFPIVFALKKYGSLRTCVDCLIWNVETECYSCPVPRMDEGIDSLEEALILSNLDANHGYGQGEIENADLYKTACTSHHRLYRFSCMHFGLQNVQRIFYQTIDVILSPVNGYLPRCIWTNISLFVIHDGTDSKLSRHSFVFLFNSLSVNGVNVVTLSGKWIVWDVSILALCAFRQWCQGTSVD